MPEATHQDIDAAEPLDRRLDDLVAVRLRARAHVDGFDLAAELLAFRRDLLQRLGAARREDDDCSRRRRALRGERAERAGRAGDDRGLAAHVEQGQRVFQEIFSDMGYALCFVPSP